MNTKEYNECVDLYSDSIYRFILKNIKNSETTNDIIQETFLKLWTKRKDVDFNTIKSYLFTIAYHTMIDYIRKEKKITSLDSVSFEPFNESTGNEYTGIREVLSKGLEKLPTLQKSLILLRDYEGYSYKEIGDIVNISESQVKVYIFRARKSLKSYLGSLEQVI
ncbi:MAG: RNA polymerase sigma factor [Bacteroidales bacterium]